MERNRARWHFVKEEDPLWYSVLLNDLFEEVHGYCFEYLDHYTEWIKPRGWCHKVILEREQLNYCVHLMGAEPPPSDVERPSEATLWSHRAGYEAAKWGGTGKNYKKARATLLETLKIHGLKEEYDYIIGGRRVLHWTDWDQFPWRWVVKERPLQTREVETPLLDVKRPPGRSRSGRKRSRGSKTTLRGDCLHHHHGAWHLPPSQHLRWPLLLAMGGSSLYRDGSPGTKDPGIPLRILSPGGGPLRPPDHLSPSHWRTRQKGWPVYTLFLRLP